MALYTELKVLLKGYGVFMKLNRRAAALLLCGAVAAASLGGCAEKNGQASDVQGTGYIDSGEIIELTEEETVPLSSGSAAVNLMLMPEASGKIVYGNDKVKIDASNTSQGYIMVKYIKKTDKRLKMIIKGPSETGYTYNLSAMADWETFPLSDGNGKYTIGVYQNVSGNSYSTVYSKSIEVKLVDEYAAFLLPNQYVNYTPESKTAAKAKELTAGKNTDLEKIKSVYSWVVTNISYDKQLAATVKSGYLPVLDNVLASKKGICFDYAALMTGMLRSQGIPCRLVVGYSGSAYHAWINTYTNEHGWINEVIYFDGTSWKLMDPTYASTGRQSKAIMNYIGDGKNYTAKYLY